MLWLLGAGVLLLIGQETFYSDTLFLLWLPGSSDHRSLLSLSFIFLLSLVAVVFLDLCSLIVTSPHLSMLASFFFD